VVHWEEGWQRVGRGGEGRRVGIGGVAGGDAPGDQGVPCGEGLGGVGTGDWRGGAQTAKGGGWRRKGIGGVASRARLVVALGKRNTKSVD
jgi:hypothetical protein